MKMNLELPDNVDWRAVAAKAQGWAEVFRLPFGRRVWKGNAGDQQGAGTGASLDFQDHRVYVPGDDPRHINWQAYARSGHYTMKLYREEVRPLVDLVVDVSPSMFLGPAKAARSVELLGFLVRAILKSGASALCHLATSGGNTRVQPERLVSPAWIEAARALENGPASAPLRLEDIPFRARSMRIILSDLLFRGDADPVLRLLSQQRGFGTIFAPFSREEAEPAWSGNHEFIDAEDGTRHVRRVEPELLRRYRAAYGRHFEDWKQQGRKHGVTVVRVPAEGDLAAAFRFEAVPSGAVEFK